MAPGKHPLTMVFKTQRKCVD